MSHLTVQSVHTTSPVAQELQLADFENAAIVLAAFEGILVAAAQAVAGVLHQIHSQLVLAVTGQHSVKIITNSVFLPDCNYKLKAILQFIIFTLNT